MVEVVDDACQTQVITLCEMSTQTEKPEIKETGASVQPCVQENESQTFVPKYSDSATQMTPPVKEAAVQPVEQKPSVVAEDVKREVEV